jgi:hypothetical protein
MTDVDRTAVEIGALHAKARRFEAIAKRCKVAAAKHYLETGVALLRTRQDAAHRGWLPWLVANDETLGFGPRRAQRLMAAAQKYVVNDAFGEAVALKVLKEIGGNTGKGARTSRRELPPIRLQHFLVGLGGVRDHGGNLTATGLSDVRGLVRESRLPNEARQRGAAAGYLGVPTDDAIADTTPDDLMDALRENAYTVGDLMLCENVLHDTCSLGIACYYLVALGKCFPF